MSLVTIASLRCVSSEVEKSRKEEQDYSCSSICYLNRHASQQISISEMGFQNEKPSRFQRFIARFRLSVVRGFQIHAANAFCSLRHRSVLCIHAAV